MIFKINHVQSELGETLMMIWALARAPDLYSHVLQLEALCNQLFDKYLFEISNSTKLNSLPSRRSAGDALSGSHLFQ